MKTKTIANRFKTEENAIRWSKDQRVPIIRWSVLISAPYVDSAVPHAPIAIDVKYIDPKHKNKA